MLRSCVSDYKIPKVVIVRSFKFTLICRSIQLIIILLGSMMICYNGYQISDNSITSLVTFRVKGMNYKPIKQNQRILIDDADYIVPPLEKDALFIMTNSIETDQEYKRYPESFNGAAAVCVNDSQCQLKQDFHYGNGRWTGRCLVSPGRCETEGWCPPMNDHGMPTPSLDTLNFNIFLKNVIHFKRFAVIKSNIHIDPFYLRQCNYHPVSDSECPIFRIGDLLSIIEPDEDERSRMLKFGGIIRINIHWSCNFDRSLSQCLPRYSFHRLDTPFIEEFGTGFNFRFSSNWKRGNRSFRTLTKAAGLRFVVSVDGSGSRFSLVVLISIIIVLVGVVYLITFIFDSIGLHIYRHAAVDQSQISGNVVEESKRKNEEEL